MINFQKNQLKEKKILFLSPSFFGYENKIVKKIEELGGTVDYYNQRSVKSSINKGLFKLIPSIYYFQSISYFNRIIRSNKHKDYDYVFIVKSDMITEKTLEIMKKTFNKAQFILYLWDSIDNVYKIKRKIRHFDKVYTFDRIDSQKNPDFIFRPLFYIDDFNNKTSYKNINYEFDLTFIGTIHSDRYRIISEIKKYCNENSLKIYTFNHLQSKLIYYIYKITKREFRNAKKNDFEYSKKKSSEIQNIVKKTKTIIDIEHPNQSGLTMRTIEMIGMKKKLITTNKDIVNYDFYNPDNILVVSRNNPQIPRSFIESSYQDINNEIYYKYSLEKWILDIFECN